MLGKLIKYDLRYCVRKFWLICAGLLALSVLSGLVLRPVLSGELADSQEWRSMSLLPMSLFVSLFIALSVLVLIFVCKRFYSGLLGDEGYLMFTLPATTAEHIAAKTITALVLMLGAGLVATLAWLLLIAVSVGAQGWDRLVTGLQEALSQIQTLMGEGPWIAVELVLIELLAVVAAILQIYFAIALGHLAHKHRAAAALAAYLGLDFCKSLLMTSLGYSSIKLAVGLGSANWSLSSGMSVQLVFSLLLGAVFFFGTKLILDKKLNLE